MDTGWKTKESWLDFRCGQDIFVFFDASRRALGSTKPPIATSTEGEAAGFTFTIIWFISWDLRSCGILRSVELHFLTDVSGQPIGPSLNGQAAQEESAETSVINCNSPLRGGSLHSRVVYTWINKDINTEQLANNSL